MNTQTVYGEPSLRFVLCVTSTEFLVISDAKSLKYIPKLKTFRCGSDLNELIYLQYGCNISDQQCLNEPTLPSGICK